MAKRDSDKQAVSIRFPKSMYDQIKEIADQQHRSFNLQVIHFIREVLNAKKPAVEEKND